MEEVKIRERVGKIQENIERNKKIVSDTKKQYAHAFERVEVAESTNSILIDELYEIRAIFCKHDKIEPGGKCSVCGLQIGQ